MFYSCNITLYSRTAMCNWVGMYSYCLYENVYTSYEYSRRKCLPKLILICAVYSILVALLFLSGKGETLRWKCLAAEFSLQRWNYWIIGQVKLSNTCEYCKIVHVKVFVNVLRTCECSTLLQNMDTRMLIDDRSRTVQYSAVYEYSFSQICWVKYDSMCVSKWVFVCERETVYSHMWVHSFSFWIRLNHALE